MQAGAANKIEVLEQIDPAVGGLSALLVGAAGGRSSPMAPA